MESFWKRNSTIFDLHKKRMGLRRGAQGYTFPVTTSPDYSDIKEMVNELKQGSHFD